MHLLTLAAIRISAVQEDRETDRMIAEALGKLKAKKASDKGGFMQEILVERSHSLQSAFSRAVDIGIRDIMHPYDVSPEDSEYLEFDDWTERLREEYENGTMDCIRLPQGKIVGLYGEVLRGSFVVRNGRVFQRTAGPLHHEKRTKRAKRMEALLSYPYRKQYKDFKDYVENEYGFPYEEEYQGYGYYYNPAARWDWFSIGGRWPEMFLVKNTCTEYSLGERRGDIADGGPEAPEGYRWVCAARKKDIAWEKVREWRNRKAAERLHSLGRMFLSGEADDGFRGEIEKDGITCGGEYIYRKGDIPEAYLDRFGIPGEWKYPIEVYDIVDVGQWMGRNDIVNGSASDKDSLQDWHGYVDDYIDHLDDETVLAGIDYHI